MRRIIVFVTSFLIVGCLPSPYYQSVETVPGTAWANSYKPVFTFNVTDTGATYFPYFIVRHTDAYPFNNIWLWVDVKQPGEKSFKRERINILLAESSGKWMGRGMGEIWEQRMRLQLGDSMTIHKAGTYQVSLEQNMRINPLPEILNVGIRVEKSRSR